MQLLTIDNNLLLLLCEPQFPNVIFASMFAVAIYQNRIFEFNCIIIIKIRLYFSNDWESRKKAENFILSLKIVQ